jgi:dimethylargininase
VSIAITRELSSELGDCQLTFLPRVEIDIGLARRQHLEYLSALESLGCEVVRLPSEPGLPDSVFVEDTALVLNELAVLCRPGAASRRGEVAGVAASLQQYRTVASIDAPGTLDGGDLLCLGKTIFAGLSTRSNRQGIGQLRAHVSAFGYRVTTVGVNDCLHLKSAVSQAGPGTLLINPDWVSPAVFRACELVEVDRSEPHAANALWLNGRAIHPASFPRTRERLESRGIEVIAVDMSELQKAEGGMTCCCLIVGTGVQ